MLHKTLNILERIIPIKEVQAHCDISCGIYDPGQVLVACLTVIRMTDLINTIIKK
jgi:nickel superoxide dismutase